jgi:nucleotidyltransferase-like protein
MDDAAQNSPRQFRTAVVPAAGLGTRFLPATKTVAKELLPVVDTSGIELVAQEAAHAGADRMVIVTSPGKQGLAAHFAEDPELEGTLARRGKFDLLERVRRAPKLLEVETVLQPRPLGLGHAVLQAESALSADESAIAVLLPDDLVRMPGTPDAFRANPSRRREDPSELRDDAEFAAAEECSVLETMAAVSAAACCAPSRFRAKRSAPTGCSMSARPRPERSRMCCGSTAWWRSPRPTEPPRLSPPPGGTCSTGPSSTRCAASSPAPTANISSPMPSRC